MGKDKKKKKRQEKEEEEEQVKKTQEKEPQKEQEKEEKMPQEVEEQKIPVIVAKKVQYCPVCTLPFQLCKYGKRAKDCKKFLQEAAPNKVAKYHPGGEEIGQLEKEEEKKEEKKEEKVTAKKEKSIKQKYVVIDVKQRAKKKFVTHISGLQIFKIDSKDLTKKLSKKLACSCSATDANSVQVQGDFYEDLRQMLIDDYKVKKRYILSGEQFKEKFKEEQEKKKQAKKLESNVIKEEENEDEKEEKEEPKPKYKTAMQQMLADVDDEEDEEN